MIAKGSAIAHGATAMSYNTGKKLSDLLLVHGFRNIPEPDRDDPVGVDPEAKNFWLEMSVFRKRVEMLKPRSRKLEKTALRFEVSPEKKDTEGWKLGQWKDLAKEFLKEMDSYNPKDKNPSTAARASNLSNSQYVVSLHHDAKSGIPHLHILVNRVDLNGEVNDIHMIGLRATLAANAITQRRGWTQANTRREENAKKVGNDCYDILRAMKDGFSWPAYKKALEAKGYKVVARTGGEAGATVVAYSIVSGKACYKSSELAGRTLTASNIYETWKKLHAPQTQAKPVSQPAASRQGQPGGTGKPAPAAPPAGYRPDGGAQQKPAGMSQPVRPEAPVAKREEKPREKRFTAKFDIDGKSYVLDVAERALEALKNEIAACGGDLNLEDGNVQKGVVTTALLLFINAVGAASTVAESCGGGGSPGNNWGRKKDEDELEWMRRCARQAVWLCKPMRRSRRR